MMTASYILGQKYYPVPYPWKKILAYIVICILLFGMHQGFLLLGFSSLINHVMAMVLILLFAFLIFKVERQEFSRITHAPSRISPNKA